MFIGDNFCICLLSLLPCCRRRRRHDRAHNVVDLHHGSDANVAAREALGDRVEHDNIRTEASDLVDMLFCDGMLPHGGVHCGCEQQRFRFRFQSRISVTEHHNTIVILKQVRMLFYAITNSIPVVAALIFVIITITITIVRHGCGHGPCTGHTCEQVIAQPVGHLGKDVGRRRRNDEDVGPLAQLDMQDRVGQFGPDGATAGRSVVAVCVAPFVGVGVVVATLLDDWWHLLLARQEMTCSVSAHQSNGRPGVQQQLQQAGDAHGRNRTRGPHKDVAPAQGGAGRRGSNDGRDWRGTV